MLKKDSYLSIFVLSIYLTLSPDPGIDALNGVLI